MRTMSATISQSGGRSSGITMASREWRQEQMSRERNVDLQLILEERLERLKRKLGISYELRVVWAPRNSNLSGEVKDSNIIYVYERDVEKALEVLSHEFVDYCITREIISPLVELINVLIKSREAEVYRRKEKIVDLFSSLL